jgi:hypothetical protein
MDVEQAMHEDTLRRDEYDHVALLDRVERAVFDEDDVTGSDRRTHARAGDAQAYAAEPSEGIGQQGWRGPGDDVGLAGRHRDQEFFLMNLQAPLVVLTLPQASAMVSKTCSRRNSGFW